MERIYDWNGNYVKEIVELIRQNPAEELKERLEKYHENDIADALEFLDSKERKKLYQALEKD